MCNFLFFIPKTSKKFPFVEIRVIICCHVKDPLENLDKNLRKSSIIYLSRPSMSRPPSGLSCNFLQYVPTRLDICFHFLI